MFTSNSMGNNVMSVTVTVACLFFSFSHSDPEILFLVAGRIIMWDQKAACVNNILVLEVVFQTYYQSKSLLLNTYQLIRSPFLLVFYWLTPNVWKFTGLNSFRSNQPEEKITATRSKCVPFMPCVLSPSVKWLFPRANFIHIWPECCFSWKTSVFMCLSPQQGVKNSHDRIC